VAISGHLDDPCVLKTICIGVIAVAGPPREEIDWPPAGVLRYNRGALFSWGGCYRSIAEETMLRQID